MKKPFAALAALLCFAAVSFGQSLKYQPFTTNHADTVTNIILSLAAGANQTPWRQNIAGGGFSLSGASNITFTGTAAGTNGIFYNSVTTPTIFNPAGTPVFDVQNKHLSSQNGLSIDFLADLLMDSSQHAALDWENRQLISAIGGTTMADWSGSFLSLPVDTTFGNGVTLGGVRRTTWPSSFSQTLTIQANAGSSTVTLDSVPPGFNTGYVIVDPWSLNAELRLVSSISAGTTLNLTGSTSYPLLYTHAIGARVMFIENATFLTWDLFGGRPGNTAWASNNSLSFNRTVTNYIKMPNFAEGVIGVPAGIWSISDELRLESGLGVLGSTVDTSKILADSTFVFPNIETAMLHGMRNGVPCTTTNGGPLSRYYVRDVIFDGGNQTGANGALISVQQPQHWEAARFVNMPGYGMFISTAQDGVFFRTEFTACGRSLWLRNCSFLEFLVLNNEQSVTNNIFADQSNGLGNFHNQFEFYHEEDLVVSNYWNDLTGVNFWFDHVWSSHGDTNDTIFAFRTTAGTGGEHPPSRITDFWDNSNTSIGKMVFSEDHPTVNNITSANEGRYIKSITIYSTNEVNHPGSELVLGVNGTLAYSFRDDGTVTAFNFVGPLQGSAFALSGMVTNFDNATNPVTGGIFTMGISQTTNIVGDLTWPAAINFPPLLTGRPGIAHIVNNMGSDHLVNTPASWKMSDYVSARTLTNGNTMDVLLYGEPNKFTNGAVVQYH